MMQSVAPVVAEYNRYIIHYMFRQVEM